MSDSTASAVGSRRTNKHRRYSWGVRVCLALSMLMFCSIFYALFLTVRETL